MADTTLVWFRNDLRIADNPALAAAVDDGGAVEAIHVEPTDTDLRRRGAASRWWLHSSLQKLAEDLAALGIQLRTVEGPTEDRLNQALADTGATRIRWNRRYGPAERALDARLKAAFREKGIAADSHPGDTLIEPFDISTGQGKPYGVFTPFWKALKQREIAAPIRAPQGGKAIKSPEVDSGYNAPKWSEKLAQHWSIGESAAREALSAFLSDTVAEYPDARDLPSVHATSRLSPHLAFGEISPRQIWHAAQIVIQQTPAKADAVDKFLSELAWRDFNIHQLYHRPDIAKKPMQEKYEALEWREPGDELERWQRGQTGIPIVDAGMRELWATGYMHNRVRMLVASLLTKNLLIDWRLGESWFWDTLVDADPASNPGNWQWVAGSGLDASPYFRIFNPVTQGERFDPEGKYVRQWVSEVADLPDKWVHKPWEAPRDMFAGSGSYPKPIVDLKSSRERALAALSAL